MARPSVAQWLDEHGGRPEWSILNGVHTDRFGDGKGTLDHALKVFEEACRLSLERGYRAILGIELASTTPARLACRLKDCKDWLAYPPLLNLLRSDEVEEFWSCRFPETQRVPCSTDHLEEMISDPQVRERCRMFVSLQ